MTDPATYRKYAEECRRLATRAPENDRRPATYRKYAEECRRLATRAPENDRRLLLEHADVWLKLAEEAERDAASET